MIIRKVKKGYTQPDEPLKLNDHGRPVTRREFIQQGFMTGAASVVAPSLLGLFGASGMANAQVSADIQGILDNQCGGSPSSKMMPFICFDLAGGVNIAGSNVLVGGPAGQKDFLSTAGYDRQGVPGDMKPGIDNTDPNAPVNEFFTEEYGLAFHTDSGFLKGINDSFRTGAKANVNGTVIAARSDNDTGNNPHNPMYGIYRAGQDGQLLTLIGSRNSDSGGNSLAPMGLYEASVRPTKIDRPTDVIGLVDTGALGGQKAVDVLETIQRLSDKKLSAVNPELNAEVEKLIRCGYVKSVDQVNNFGTPSDLDPMADPFINGALGDPNAVFDAAEISDTGGNREYRKTASVMKMVLDNGLAGAGTITMGGYDYHTGDRVTGEVRDYRAGRCIGACLEYAALKGQPLMIYVFSDGSVFSNGTIDNMVSSQNLRGTTTPIYDGGAAGKGVWTGDNSGTAASFILAYNPGGPINLINGEESRRQIGYYSSNGNVVTSSSPAANNVTSLVDLVCLNYMAMHQTIDKNGPGGPQPFDGISQFDTDFNHSLGGAAALDGLVAFEPFANT